MLHGLQIGAKDRARKLIQPGLRCSLGKLRDQNMMTRQNTLTGRLS